MSLVSLLIHVHVAHFGYNNHATYSPIHALFSCIIQMVRNMMDVAEECGFFFDKHPVRMEILKRHIHELAPEASRQKLIQMCQTR